VLAVHVRTTEWLVAWTPVPESAIVPGEPVAVLVTVTVPLSLPEELGLKITLNVILCPAVRVTGVPAPLSVNPAPLSVICETITLALPELVTVTFCVDDDPVFTFPKPTVVVLKVSAWVAATPLPLRATTAGEFGALLTMVKLPLAAPADAGANWTLKLVDWPAFSVMGKDKGLVLKPLPATLTWVTVRVPVPLFVNWMVCVLGEPTVTFPRLALAGIMVKPGWTPVPDTGIVALVPCKLITVMFPVMFSEAVGLKATLMAAFCPDAKMTGAVSPLTAKSFAFTVICEMVRLVLPVLVIVTLFELELPAFTFVKLTLVGLDESATDAAVPVPLRESTLGELGALLMMPTVPLRLPAVVGAKRTANVVLLPAAIVAGVTSPLTL
jgi:hypothetical protein